MSRPLSGSTAQGHAVVAGLRQAHISHLVVSPGSRNTPLVLAWRQLMDRLGLGEQIRVHTVLDERAAGFYALGLSRVGFGPVALACTSGSAGAHYLPALVEATASGIPLVVLTADRPAELVGTGAPQTIDQRELYGRHAKASLDLPADAAAQGADWVAGAVADLAVRAQLDRPGPVHINVRFRKPLWQDGAPPALELGGHERVESLEPDATPYGEHFLASLAQRLVDHPRGAFLVGHMEQAHNVDVSPFIGVDLDGAPVVLPSHEGGAAEPLIRLPHALSRLARHLGWPVLTEPTSQVRYTGDVLAPHRIDTAATLLADPETRATLRPELVVQLGRTPTSKAVQTWLGEITGVGPEPRAPDASTGRLMTIDPYGDRHDPSRRGTVLQAWPVQLLEAVADTLDARPPTPDGTWLADWRRANDAARTQLAQVQGRWAGPVVQAVLRALPHRAALHVGSSMPVRDLDAFGLGGLCGQGVTVYASRGANGIDGTLCQALGEAERAFIEAGPAEVPLVLLCGDLTFLHDLGGLAIAARARTKVSVVVFDNDGGGIFQHLPVANQGQPFEDHFLTPQAVDGLAMAAAAGLRTTECADAAALEVALEACVHTRGVDVLRVRCPRDEDLAAHRHTQAAVSADVSAALKATP